MSEGATARPLAPSKAAPAAPRGAPRSPDHAPAVDSRLLPAGRLAWLLALPLLALILAPGIPELVSAALGVDAALVLLALFDAQLARRTTLTIRRQLPTRLSAGVPARVVLTVANRDRRPVHLAIHDAAPASFEVDTDTHTLTVPRHSEVELPTRLTPTARGRFDWGGVHVRIRGPLGLAWHEAAAPLDREVKVYPDLRGVSRLLLAGGVRDLTVMGVHTVRREGEGSELELLREYVPGDAYRDIDWKATARRQEPVVRVHQPERSQTVLLCVDAGRLMAVESGGLSKLDHAVNAALLTAFTALANHDRVGLLVFADDVQAWVPPRAGRGQYRHILEALYQAQPSRTYVDYRNFARAVLSRQKRRALVLTFTELHDEATSRPLIHQTKKLATRHLPVVLALRDPALEAIARGRPQSPEDPWRMAVAAELLDERDALVRGLSTAGARVLDRTPGEAMIAAVNAYLEVKRRGRL